LKPLTKESRFSFSQECVNQKSELTTIALTNQVNPLFIEL